MLNSEALDELCGIVNRTAPQTRARLLRRLNQSIQSLERGPVKPWFLETEVEGGPLVVPSQGYIDLPEDFLEEYEEGALRLLSPVDGSWSEPKKVEVEKLERLDSLEDGKPCLYAIFGDRLYLRPVPDQEYEYKFKYYGRTVEVPDDSEPVTNEWLLEFYDFTLYSAAHAAARTFLRAPDIAKEIKPMLDMEKDSFWRAVESRKHVNMDYLLGNRED